MELRIVASAEMRAAPSAEVASVLRAELRPQLSRRQAGELVHLSRGRVSGGTIICHRCRLTLS